MKDTASNHLFSDRYEYNGDYRTPTEIILTTYGSDSFESRRIDPDLEKFEECIVADHINWFEVTGLTDTDLVYDLLDALRIERLDAKAILTPFHAAKIDENECRLIIVLRSCIFEDNETVTSEHIAILSKENVVLTFNERDTAKFDIVKDMVRDNTMDARNYGRGLLVAFLLNSIFSETIGTVIKVEEMLEDMDDTLLNAEHNSIDVRNRLQQCRHANLIIQKNSNPLCEEYHKLFETGLVRSHPYLMEVYKELYNQLDFIVLTSKNAKELLSSMRDLYSSTSDLKINTVMRRLTVVSTVFAPITFLAGLWGMNYILMPELQWKYGYLFAWGIIILTAVLTLHYMKKNRWF